MPILCTFGLNSDLISNSGKELSEIAELFNTELKHTSLGNVQLATQYSGKNPGRLMLLVEFESLPDLESGAKAIDECLLKLIDQKGPPATGLVLDREIWFTTEK